MKLAINGHSDTRTISETDLGGLVDRLLKERETTGEMLVKIRLDGKEVDPNSPEVRERLLSDIELLEVDFTTLAEIINRNIDNAREYLVRFLPGVERASELFRTGNEQEANQFFLNIIDGIDWLSQVIDSVVLAKQLKAETVVLHNQTLKARKDRLLDLTQQALTANRNKDWVLLADLLEYEILPYYQELEEILPELQQL